MPERLILVRHGETTGTEHGRYYGRTDMPLNVKGAEQARKLYKWLERYPFHYIYTSPLKRCKETASIIKGKCNIPTIISPELQEIDFGKWEGLTLTEMQRQNPKRFNSWFLDFEKFRMPGGEDVIVMIKRVQRFLKKVIRKYPQKSILIVTHGGPAKVMVMAALGLAISNFWRLHIATGSVSVIEFMGDEPLVRCFNVVP